MKELLPTTTTEKPFIKDFEQATEFAERYSVPKDDILLMALNLSGIQSGNVENDRGRFYLTMPNGRLYRLALTVTTPEFTNFKHTGESVLLDSMEIGKAGTIEKDTCTDSYWRGHAHLTLNSNQRSLCKGCGFCGTYDLERGDSPLTDRGSLEAEANQLLLEVGDFSQVKAIGIVTGCFMDENSLVKHIKMVRSVFSERGFKGEIQYVGSQLKNESSITELVKDGPFSLFLTVEMFSNRDELMKKQKSSLSLDRARELLGYTRSIGAGASFLYISGLDSLDTFKEELPKFAKVINRFPQIQTYQLYSPKQIVFRHANATTLDYFLNLRQFTENTLPDLTPVIFHNYRGLWYTNYLGKQL